MFIVNAKDFALTYRFLFICSFISFIYSCSTTSAGNNNSPADYPSWLSGDSAEYPNSLYLTAVGAADTLESAQQRALGNLAKIFEVRIVDQSSTTETIQESRSSNNSSFSRDIYANNTVSTSTDELIEGASISSRWQNPVDFTYYALAVLDRALASNNFRHQMDEIDKKIEESIELSHSAPPLRNFLLRKDAYNLFQERNALNSNYIVIAGSAYPSAYQDYPFIQNIRDAQSNVSISIIDDGNDSISNLDDIITKHLGSVGFIVENNADYRLNMASELDEPYDSQNWYWQEARISVELVKIATQETLGQDILHVRASSTDIRVLSSRLNQEIDKSLEEFLIDFMFNKTNE